MKKQGIYYHSIIIFLFFTILLILPISINAQIVDSPIIEATLAYQNPDPVQPGEEVELKWSIKNTGSSTAKNTQLRLQLDYPFSISSGETEIKSIGDISVYDAKKIDTGETSAKYKLLVDENAIEGDYELVLKYRTEEGISRGNWIELEPFTISVGSKATNIIIKETKTIPERISPGEDGEVTITLANEGQGDIKDIVVKMDLENINDIAIIGMSNEVVVQRIATNQSKEITFHLLIAPLAEIKIYKIPVKLEYSDERGNSYEKTTNIAIIVDAEPEYVLNIEENDVYTTKQKGNIVISLSNIGISEIKYATLSLLPSEYYTILSSDTAYLGNLESDDYETAQFTIYSNKYKEELPLEFVLVYKDSYNKNYKEDITVTVKMFTGFQAKKYGLKESNIGIVVIVFVILAVIGCGWYLWKIKKKK